MTVVDVAEAWLGRIVGSVAGTTHAAYARIVRRHLAPHPLGAMPIARVRPTDVRAFLLDQRRRGWSPGFVRMMQTVCSCVGHEAVERRFARTNCATELWRRTPPELRIVTDPGQHMPPEGGATAVLRRLWSDHVDLARVVAVYAHTGCRRSEALGLQAEDVEFTRGTLTIRRQWLGSARRGGTTHPPKGRRPRTVDLAAALAPVLRDAIAESERIAAHLGRPALPRWIFRSAYTGLPWHPSHVSRVVRDVATLVTGRPFGPKSIRHAVASHLMNTGRNPRYVQSLLGHGALATTMVYVESRGLRDPAAVDDLDGHI